jgi:hypothetical protein
MMEYDPETLLSIHADALISGEDIGSRLLQQYPEHSQEISPLLQLAGSIKEALLPVQAPELKSRIWQELEETASSPRVRFFPKSRRRLVMMTVATGSLLSAVGLGVWFLRRFRSMSESGAQTVATTA